MVGTTAPNIFSTTSTPFCEDISNIPKLSVSSIFLPLITYPITLTFPADVIFVFAKDLAFTSDVPKATPFILLFSKPFTTSSLFV